jgi:N-acetyl-anhydromuramyl-L-alanine amidase AmpD
MAYVELTKLGKNFITEVCNKGGSGLLSGKKSKPMPYTVPLLYQTWTCDIVDPKDTSKKITTSLQLSNALIYWFDTYSKMYGLDANVIAAQAYIESNYVMWAYSDAPTSTASGVNQFLMMTTFGIIVDNEYPTIKMTYDEINAINYNLINKTNKDSYNVNITSGGNIPAQNRPLLHQNVINNPAVMIKAQCRYMKYIADNCESLTSSSLFCYSRGIYFGKTYSRCIQRALKDKNNDYIQEGLNYVLKIFGVLGDKNNLISIKGYKPSGLYFGYDEQMGTDDPKNLKLNQTFNPNSANIVESEEYNIKYVENDIVAQALSTEPKYIFIYYSEKLYYPKATLKKQIVLHHTVSGDNVANDVHFWETEVAKTGDKVAVSFIVARRGEIFQLFSTDYWAYHLGISDTIIKTNNLSGNANNILNEQSIGIEIDSWGGLMSSGGYWYPVTSNEDHLGVYYANTKQKPIPDKDVVQYNASNGYPQGFHGFYAFEKYTDAQIETIRIIINAIRTKFPKIPTTYVNDLYKTDMWGTYDDAQKKWLPSLPALQGNEGVWTHVSYRYDKSDCHPQPELIKMLKSL